MAAMREQIASLQNILERQRRSDSKSTHKVRQETIKETTEACNELESLSLAWKQIQEGRDPGKFFLYIIKTTLLQKTNLIYFDMYRHCVSSWN